MHTTVVRNHSHALHSFGVDFKEKRDIYYAQQKRVHELYSGPDRYYHNWIHIADSLRLLSEWSGAIPRCLEIADYIILYHDVIHDTHKFDNEEQSALYARRDLEALGCADEGILLVERGIMASAHKEPGQDLLERLVQDIDLSILGADAGQYWDYAIAIRKEYQWVPEKLFKENRRKLLQGFLDRSQRGELYQLGWFQDRFGERARENLEREIRALS